MKILYDYQAFEMQKFGGISRYFANLYKSIPLQSGFSTKISVVASNNYYFNELDIKKHFHFLTRFPNRSENVNKNYSRFCISKDNFDIFHPTYYHPYFLKKLKKPFVLTVHDFTHEKYPAFFQSNDPTIERKQRLIEKADKIIAISNATKNDLLLYYPHINPNKVEVVHHGHFSIINNDTLDIKLPDNYILYVGDRRGYKNFFTLIDALTEIKLKDITLVCTGSELTTIEKSYINFKKVQNRVVQMRVSDKQLYHIYQKAKLFIYPSLYEGFGLPILEAFECKCPTLLSDIDCFQEVATNNALYFNPISVHDITEKINYALDNLNLMKQFADGGYKRLSLFTPENNVKNTLAIYSSIK